MVEIVINYDPAQDEYKIYEPTTDTLLLSKNLTEALVNLSLFLQSTGMITTDLLGSPDITYHLDSYTLKGMVESNVALLKKLKTAPSGFMISNQRFGGNTGGGPKKSGDSGFGKKDSGRGTSRRSSSFSGKSGFKTANKKFGSQG